VNAPADMLLQPQFLDLKRLQTGERVEPRFVHPVPCFGHIKSTVDITCAMVINKINLCLYAIHENTGDDLNHNWLPSSKPLQLSRCQWQCALEVS
jgi:hypothetical protein